MSAKPNTSICYLYCITYRATKKKYIGMTNNPTRRWADHQKCAIDGDLRPLYQDMRKHGVKKFTFSVLLTGPRWVVAHAEIAMIAHWKARVPTGYNIHPGGETRKRAAPRKRRRRK